MSRSIGCLLILSLLAAPVAARSFNSELHLKVWARGTNGVPDHVIGFTPVRGSHRILIPVHGLWYIHPSDPMNGLALDKLAREIRQYSIPGLDLSDHWELSDASLNHLQSLPSLHFLNMSRTRITDKGLLALSSLPGLSILMLPPAITNQGLEALRVLPALRELNLDHTQMTSKGMQGLGGFPKLERLVLSATFVTDDGLVVLKRLPRLRTLVLNRMMTDASGSSLKAAVSLEEIDLSQTQMTDDGMTALAGLSHLTSLYLNKAIGDRGLESVAHHSSLRTLDLSGAAMTDEGVKHLVPLKSLQELILAGTSIGDASLLSVAQLPNLRILDVSNTHVTGAGLAPLRHLQKLEIISLTWQTLSREDLESMARLSHLKTIILNGIPLAEATMVQLRHMGRLSLWKKPQGIERAQLNPGDYSPFQGRADPMNASSLKALSAGTIGPASPEKIADRSRTAMVVKGMPQLKSSGSSPTVIRGAANPISSAGPEAAAAATPVAEAVAPRNHEEDQLLKIITLESRPSKAGAFSGLAGMKRVQFATHNDSLSDLAAEPKEAVIPVEDDRPENSLGEIQINAVKSRP